MSFYWPFKRELSYQYFVACAEANTHSSDPPSSPLLQQWKTSNSGKEQGSGRATFQLLIYSMQSQMPPSAGIK